MSKYLIYFLYLHLSLADRVTVPVFLSDYGRILSNVQIQPNPFAKMSTTEFKNIIATVTERSKVVLIFIEHSFCVEDISMKDRQGTPFYHLNLGVLDKSVKYFPSVIEPAKVLMQSFPQFEQNVFYLGASSSTLKIYDGKFKHLYIYFQDGFNESRSNALRRHDLIMKELYFVVREIASGPIVAFYTGSVNPVVVEKVNFSPIHPYETQKKPGVTVVSYRAMFRLIGVSTSIGARRSMFNQIPIVAVETWTPERLTTRMTYTDFELEFSFQLFDRNWIVDTVSLLEWGEEVGRTKIDGGAPWNCSYICGEPLVLVNTRDASVVTISQYQLQPFQINDFVRSGRRDDNDTTDAVPASPPQASGNASGGGFGDAVHCSPYFTSQILAGLMVTFLCLGMLCYGVIFMFNCHSNDRYDDPHGKPLVIISDGSH